MQILTFLFKTKRRKRRKDENVEVPILGEHREDKLLHAVQESTGDTVFGTESGQDCVVCSVRQSRGDASHTKKSNVDRLANPLGQSCGH